ncbi:MAG: bifunctional DNA-formamidopyrimidine glycosylase/DNA-(apurinic or apyrimidinic site) lyase [Actinobacteria bacterium]|nr:MAG: bifunctional DNA-formamidopyrimidine glycosylase/DNA-(apurinic or apyrimidinic site) lyase [Actinomycetota bacterium]
MPELPEVETIRSQLAPSIEGGVLAELTVLDPRWCAPLAPVDLAAAVEDRRVHALGRRGKYLVWELAGELFLICHLRMTGTLLLDPHTVPAHTRVRMRLASGRTVLFVDPRRFGTGQLASGRADLEAFMAARLGVEPLGSDFTAERLGAQARGRRAPVKAFLLDQRRLAGVGNIYADEALFRARIHPLRPAGSLTARQWARLRDAVVAVLRAGVRAGGATIDDFRGVDGVRGSFQNEFLVHRRAGEPCPACGASIVKFLAAGRGTYACERCQPRPRARPRPRSGRLGAR